MSSSKVFWCVILGKPKTKSVPTEKCYFDDACKTIPKHAMLQIALGRSCTQHIGLFHKICIYFYFHFAVFLYHPFCESTWYHYPCSSGLIDWYDVSEVTACRYFWAYCTVTLTKGQLACHCCFGHTYELFLMLVPEWSFTFSIYKHIHLFVSH